MGKKKQVDKDVLNNLLSCEQNPTFSELDELEDLTKLYSDDKDNKKEKPRATISDEPIEDITSLPDKEQAPGDRSTQKDGGPVEFEDVTALTDSMPDTVEDGFEDEVIEEIDSADPEFETEPEAPPTATVSHAGKKVLVVEDYENLYLPSLTFCLDSEASGYQLERIGGSGEAMSMLASDESASLVVIDLRMPDMEGFKLLAHMSIHHHSVPVIVMSAYSNPESEAKLQSLGTLRLLNNPLDLDELPCLIDKGLTIETGDDSIADLALTSFLQLVEMEQKTTLLEIRNEGNELCRCYFKRGSLENVTCGQVTGIPAVAKVLYWENISVDFVDLPEEGVDKQLDMPVEDILNQALNGESADSGGKAAPVAAAEGSAEPDTQRQLEKILAGFEDVNGYRASALVQISGDIIAKDILDESQLDFVLVALVFADIYRSASETILKTGLNKCAEVITVTDKGIIVVRAVEREGKINEGIVVLLSMEGDIFQIREKIDSVLSDINKTI